MDRREKGRAGEALAADYLAARGYLVLQRNYRYGRYPEIDIIAEKSGCLCFIEVKTRYGETFGPGRDAVDRRKQRKLRLAASLYLSREQEDEREIRFDVVEITMVNLQPHIVLIENAF